MLYVLFIPNQNFFLYISTKANTESQKPADLQFTVYSLQQQRQLRLRISTFALSEPKDAQLLRILMFPYSFNTLEVFQLDIFHILNDGDDDGDKTQQAASASPLTNTYSSLGPKSSA